MRNIVLLFLLLGSNFARAEDAKSIPIADIQHKGPVDFATEVLPILRRNCLACHNAASAKAKLVLETPQTIAKGGVNGPVVSPGKADESMLLLVAAHESKPFMPPADNDRRAFPLTSDELGLVKQWINEGAKGEVRTNTSVEWQPLPPGMKAVYAAAITSDGRYAAASRANQIFVYNVSGKRELGRLTDPALLESGIYKQPGVADLDVIQSLAFSPDGEALASGGFRNVKLWRRPKNVQLAKWTGLESTPKSFALSPDRKFAAIGEDSGKIRLFEVATGQSIAALEGHTAAVTAVGFSADGAKLVSGSQDKAVRIWDVAGRKTIGLLTTSQAVSAALLVNEDKQLATGGGDNMIRVWDLPTSVEPPAEPAKPVREIQHNTPVVRMWPADEKAIEIFAIATNDGGARRWNMVNFNQVRSFDGDAEARGVAMRPDGSRLMLVAASGNIKLWDANNGQVFPDTRSDVRVAWKADGIDLAINLSRRKVQNAKQDLEEANAEVKREQDNIPKVTEARKQAENELKQKTEAAVKPVADKEMADKELAVAEPAFAAAEEARKAAEKADDAVRNAAQQALDQARQKLQQAKDRVQQTKEPAVRAVGERTTAERNFKQLSRTLEQTAETLKKAQAAVPPVDAALKLEEETLKQIEATLPPARELANKPFSPHRAVAVSPDGSQFAVAGDDGVVRTFSADDSQLVETYEGHAGPVSFVDFTTAGDLISVGDDKSIIVWDVDPAWKLERTIGSAKSSDFVDRVTALAFSPDGAVLASGGGEPSRSGEVKLWNASTGQPMREIPEAHSDTVLGMEFSPDGKHLATAAADRFVKVYDIVTGQRVRSFEGHTNHATGVSWRADGRILASSGAEGATKIWDFRSGEQRTSFIGWGREATSVQFFGVEDKIIGSTADGGIRLKRTDSGEERSWGDGAVYYFLTRASAGAKFVLGAGDDGKLAIWRGDNNTAVAEFAAP